MSLRLLHTLLPDDGEIAGLLALMLVTDARRAARTGPDGELIPLTQQDRALWDQNQISEGIALLTDALSKGSIGVYQLQAAIAAVHDEAVRAEDTYWPQILALYELLKRMSDNPMVVLNHAIAAAMAHGPSKGLELLRALESDTRIAGHHRLDAVRAHLLEMAGNHQAAIKHYRIAASRTTSIPEWNYLITQAARFSESTPSPDRTVPRTDQQGAERHQQEKSAPNCTDRRTAERAAPRADLEDGSGPGCGMGLAPQKRAPDRLESLRMDGLSLHV